MTNEEIIFRNSVQLVEHGILKMVKVGETEVPEPIHTFNGWKERDYCVKKGEKSFIKFNIWKAGTKNVKTKGNDRSSGQIVEDEEKATSMFMKLSAFFTFAQVEPLAK